MARNEQTYPAAAPAALYYPGAPVELSTDQPWRSVAALNARARMRLAQLAELLWISLLLCVFGIPLAVNIFRDSEGARARRRADREGFAWLWNDLGRSRRWRLSL